MGFGLLLIGYFTAAVMSLNTLSGVFAFLGYIIMAFAAKKLSQYNSKFLLLLASSIFMALLCAFNAFCDVSAFLYNNLLISQSLVPTGVADAALNIRLVLELVFVGVLCYCIRNIAKETGAEKISYAAARNFVFFCISFVLQAIVWLSSQTQSEALLDFVTGTALPVWMVIITLFCVLLNCVMLFSCYSKICDADDVEMPQKPSRFAFINRKREQREQKIQQYQKLVEEPEIYSEEQKKRITTSKKKKK